jgi:SAM-dependent methyltransferase
MAADLNPQARHMADESMVRNLAAQAEAVWPQELPILRRHALPAAPRILDAGCGTGEATWRLAEAFPDASLLGVDILEASLERARGKAARFGSRVRFEHRSIYELGLPSASFDLVVCRHVLQSIPHAEQVVAELARVARPGGRLHLVAEDYGMIHFPTRRLDPARMWPEAPLRFGAATGTDMFVGRRAPAILAALGLEDVSVDYVVVDPLRVPRETFARIWLAWRDGYSETIAAHVGMTPAEVEAHFDDQIETIRDPRSYAVWIVPVVGGVVR